MKPTCRCALMIASLAAAILITMPAVADDGADTGSASELDPYAPQTQPTTQPALPEGHPVLPQGHPPMGDGQPSLPEGHPPMQGGQPPLPGGHPPLPQGHPPIGTTTQPAMVQATLVVRAVQKTADGPHIENDQVTIQMLVRGRAVDTIKTKLDAHGVAMVEDRLLPNGAQPLVTIVHAGVKHQAAGEPFTAQAADQIVTVPVYEITEQAPEWRVRMWHIMITPSNHGVRVSQLLAVENPTDRSWIGMADKTGERTTLVLPMSPNAMNAELGKGFHDCCSKVVGGNAVDSMPLLPGTWRYEMEFGVPVHDGTATIEFETPAAAEQIVIAIPDGHGAVNIEGMGEASILDGPNQRKIRMYQARVVEPGRRIVINLSDLGLPDTLQQTSGQTNMPKVLAGGGVAVVALLAVGMLMSPSRKNRAKPGEGSAQSS